MNTAQRGCVNATAVRCSPESRTGPIGAVILRYIAQTSLSQCTSARGMTSFSVYFRNRSACVHSIVICWRIGRPSPSFATLRNFEAGCGTVATYGLSHQTLAQWQSFPFSRVGPRCALCTQHVLARHTHIMALGHSYAYPCTPYYEKRAPRMPLTPLPPSHSSAAHAHSSYLATREVLILNHTKQLAHSTAGSMNLEAAL